MKKAFVYYGKKVLIFFLSVLLLSVAVFYISRLAPGDPLMSYYGDRIEKMSVAEKNAAREKLWRVRLQKLRRIRHGSFHLSQGNKLLS